MNEEMMMPRYVELCFLLITLRMLLLFQSALSSGGAGAGEYGCTRSRIIFSHQDEGVQRTPAVGVKHKRESKARGSSSTWKLEVVHRDTLLPANARPSYEQRWEETLRRDAARLRQLEQQIERRLNGSYVKLAAEEVGSGVVSGVAVRSGEYFTRIGVGTPARYQYMVLSTDSDVTWIQCAPCSKCHQQVDPIFNPAYSASFSAVTCYSDVCSQVDVHGCSRDGGCVYRVDYGDGSYTIGVMATETLTFDDNYVCDVAIGCGSYNTVLFVGAAGILGLGAGSLSLPSKVRTQFGGVFSYCLVDRDSKSTGTLEFGAQSVPLESFFTPMERNSQLPTFYYLSLAAITVGCTNPIPPAVFSIDRTSGRGGVILNSGTTVTYLQRAAYEAMRDAFRAGTQNLRRVAGFSILDTCYDLSWSPGPVTVPAVDFHFSNGKNLPLPASNYLVRVDTMGTHCFAFAPTDSALSIIGNIQQQHIGVSFDSNNGQIGFALDQC